MRPPWLAMAGSRTFVGRQGGRRAGADKLDSSSWSSILMGTINPWKALVLTVESGESGHSLFCTVVTVMACLECKNFT
jgi:hypothetical protein